MDAPSLSTCGFVFFLLRFLEFAFIARIDSELSLSKEKSQSPLKFLRKYLYLNADYI